ncbi:hypothetical protein CC80DRAFT_495009 [Byssothecium circinans]|uniref:Uncharacterized protein n=1 Tax=Byssothecium circinans TaxID=147558 RepID=A0A6A5TLS2_9PLEO|nr:hypothetical protein CC80DRAFT_495009 [Byssothecium circinans]
MCQYRIIHYGSCKHSELTTIAYCKRACEPARIPQREAAEGQPQRAADVDRASEGPSRSDLPAELSSSPTTHSPSQHQHQHQPHDMSTLAPTEAGSGAINPLTATHSERPPHAAFIPRSVHGNIGGDAHHPDSLLDTSSYSNLSIAIPPGTQSSVSMELSHDATFGEGTRASSVATIRPIDSDVETLRASPVSMTAVAAEALSSPALPSPEAGRLNLRKPIPQEWTPPQGHRGAPKLQTERRGLEREKKKAAQANTPPKTLRGSRSSVDVTKSSFLTKEKTESIATSPLSPFSPESPRVRRQDSKASLKSPVRSPGRANAGSNVQIAASPTKTTLAPASSAHTRASSVISSADTEFYSARHSPVSGNNSQAPSEFHSPSELPIAEDLKFPFPHLSLADTDVNGQKTSDSAKAAKPHKPRLSVKIPFGSVSGKPPFTLGSASSSGSVSPTRPSRLPQPSKAVGNSATMSRAESKKSNLSARSVLKPPHEVPLPLTPLVPTRHVRTLNSAGITPIITQESLASSDTQPDPHALVSSYLEKVEPGTPTEPTPFTEELASSADLTQAVTKTLLKSAEAAALKLSAASRVTSASTVKATSSEDPILKDTAVVYSRKKSHEEAGHLDSQSVLPTTEPVVDPVAPPARGRGNEFAPKNREQTQSQHSLHSINSELRATAPEFVPNAPLPAPAPRVPYDPLGPDRNGIPWCYYMYPVPIQWIRPEQPTFPKKSKTMPRSRKRAQSAVSPKKVLSQLEKYAAELDEKSEAGEPFARQLEEIARNAELRNADTSNKEPEAHPIHLALAHAATLPYRATRPHPRGNGLFDELGHSRPGIPIDETVPFPHPTPPTGHKSPYVGYSIKKEKAPTGCGVMNIVDNMEWGGKLCNKCEPDH